MLLSEAKTKALILLGEDLNDPDTEVTSKFNTLFDVAQKEVATIQPIIKKIRLTQSDKRLGVTNSYINVDHYDEDIIYSVGSGKCYFIQVDDNANVYIEEYTGGNWVVMETLTFTSEGFLRGVFTGTNDKRVRFSGSTYYRIFNFIMWDIPYSVDRVPFGMEYAEYTLPTDFYYIEKIKLDNEKYIFDKDTVYISTNYNGIIEIEYRAYPTTIDDSTPDTYEFEISADGQECLPYYVSANVKGSDDEPQAYARLYNEYQSKLGLLNTNRPYSIELRGGKCV